MTGADFTLPSSTIASCRFTLAAVRSSKSLAPRLFKHELDVRSFHLRRRPNARVGDHLAGHQRLPFERVRSLAVHLPADRIALLARENLGAGRRLRGIGTAGHQLELQNRRLADEILRALRVLDARQLNQDAVGAATLDDRLTDTELIDAVPNRLDGLIDRELADTTFLALIEPEHRIARLSGRIGGGDEDRKLILQKIGETRALAGIAQLQVDPLPDPLELAGRDLRRGELALQILHRAVERRLDRLVAFDLQDQMNAALEIQTEPKRLRAGGSTATRSERS